MSRVSKSAQQQVFDEYRRYERRFREVYGKPEIPTVPQMTVVKTILPDGRSLTDEESLVTRWERLTQPMDLHGATAMGATVDEGMVLTSQLAVRMPWLEPLPETIEASLKVQMAVGRPWLTMPPTLLLGPPGCGKSHAGRLIGRLSGCAVATLDLAGMTDNRLLEGTSRGWTNTQPCWPLIVMAGSGCANPVLVVDELEKAGGSARQGRPHDTLLGMLEPSTARVYGDRCLLAAADISQCSWIFTANSLEGVSRPLLSRLTVIEVKPPTAAHFEVIVDGIIGDLARGWELPVSAMPLLQRSTMKLLRDDLDRHRSIRRLVRLVEAAIGSSLGRQKRRALD